MPQDIGVLGNWRCVWLVDPRFVIFLDNIGEYRFRLIAPNNEIIIASQGYDEKTSCLKGIDSVKRNAAPSPIYDLTAGQESVGGSKFEVFEDSKNEFRFRLVAANEEIIAASQGYDAKASCLDGIESVKRNAPIAITVDNTPTTAHPEKHGVLWKIMARLVYSYFFRGMWWRDSMTGSDYRDQYPYEE